MKIAISAQAAGFDAGVDERFGRAQGFAIVTIEGNERSIDFLPNTQNLQAAQGAGIQAAQHVTDAGAEALLTGHVGPKAFTALNAGRVKIYHGVKGTVQNAVDDYLAGNLDEAHGADVEGHW